MKGLKSWANGMLHFSNLSTNFFSGEIPNVGVLGTFRNSS